MKPLRVLSIDWDYLVDATMEQRIMLFPDGGNENLPTSYQDLIWQFRYENEELLDISVDTSAIECLKSTILKGCNKDTQCMVWDSHMNIYDEISMKLHKNQPLKVANVDFHHDMYINDCGELDCGNWVNCIFEEGKYHLDLDLKHSSYFWIPRPDSDDFAENIEWVHRMSLADLYSLFEENSIDLLFICRSSVWSPPHLDEEFEKFYTWINDNVVPVEVNITGSRYTSSFQSQAKQYKNEMESIKRNFK